MFNIAAVGTIGRVDVKTLSGGTIVAQGSIASNRQVKGVKTTDWLDWKAFGKTAEVIGDFVRKGDQAIFSGSLQTESWEKDGQKQSKVVMVVERFEFGKNKRETEQATDSAQFNLGFVKSVEAPISGAFDSVTFDDIPF